MFNIDKNYFCRVFLFLLLLRLFVGKLLLLDIEVLFKFYLEIYFLFYKLNISGEILVVIIIYEKCEYGFVYKRIL